jgi:hypothetical protein
LSTSKQGSSVDDPETYLPCVYVNYDDSL